MVVFGQDIVVDIEDMGFTLAFGFRLPLSRHYLQCNAGGSGFEKKRQTIIFVPTKPVGGGTLLLSAEIKVPTPPLIQSL
jgi:hypothetical protein